MQHKGKYCSYYSEQLTKLYYSVYDPQQDVSED